MIIGICSYLPLDDKLRQFRLGRIKKQKEFFDTNLPGIKIYCCAQQYRDEDYLSGIEYIKFEKPIGQSKARNELLKVFYNSDEDFILLADDDTWLYPYYDCINYFKDLLEDPKPFLKLDLVSGVLPVLGGFKQKIIDNFQAYESNHILTPLDAKTLAFTLLKNQKKYYGKEYYLSEIKYKGFHEDIDFIINLFLEGRTLRTNSTFILNTPFNPGTSTLFNDFSERTEGLEKTRKDLIEKYGEDKLFFTQGNKLDYRALRKRYDKLPEYIIIPRKTKMVLTENLKNIVKRTQKPEKRGLF